MLMLHKLLCAGCLEEHVPVEVSTLLTDEAMPASTDEGSTRVLEECSREDPAQGGERSGNERSTDEGAVAEEGGDKAGLLPPQSKPLTKGLRVRARVAIHYQALTVQVGTLGTVVECRPTIAVSWDDFETMPRAIVRRSQVEPLQEMQEEARKRSPLGAPRRAKGVHFAEDGLAAEAIPEGKLLAAPLAEAMAPHDACLPASPFDVRVTVVRDSLDEVLGLSFDPCNGRMLCIHAIRPGKSAVAAHNAAAPEEQQIRPGDFVIEVSGVRGSAKAMMKQAESETEARFVLRRAISFVVELDRRGGTLGLGLNHSSRAASLVVEAIQEGPATRWNQAVPDRAMQRGDRIETVNGYKGSSRELLQGLSDSGPLALLVSRPEGPEAYMAGEGVPSGNSSTTGSGACGESVCSGSSSSARDGAGF